jgi:hypothetical protein
MQPMLQEARMAHALFGRIFDITMMCFDIPSCDCCGLTAPLMNASTTTAMQSLPFRLEHFAMKFHDCYLCNCDGICRGAQFYHYGVFKHKHWFECNHASDQHAWGTEANANICHLCFVEVGDHVDQLEFAWMYSQHNGFGPIPTPPPSHPFSVLSERLIVTAT